MKKFLITILALITLILAAICVRQSSDLSTQKVQLANLQAELKKETAHNESQQVQVKHLLQEKAGVAMSPAPRGKNSGKTKSSTAPTSAAPEEESKAGFGGMMAKMLKDPEMKKALMAQQSGMLKKMYGPLMKSLNLTPEESEKFSAMLSDHQMANMEAGSSLLGGGDKTEATQKMQDSTKEFESQMKEFLGDDHYKQYTDYQQTLADRMTMDQFKGQLDDHPLSDEQSQQLLQLMIAERKKAGATLPNEAESMKLLSSEDALNKYMDQATIAGQNVLSNAALFLTPEQLKSLGEFQSNQFALQKAGMVMARQMMGGSNSVSTPNIPGSPAVSP